MSALAIILVLISGFCHSLKSFFIKKSLDKEIFVWCYTTTGLIFYFPLFIFFAIREQFPLSYILGYGILAGGIHFLYQLFFTKSYEEGDLSLVYPIMRSSPALVLVCAVLFLGEEVSFKGGCGISLVAFGVYIINLKSFTLKNLLLPLRSLFSDRSTRYALLTMLSVTAYSIVDKVAAMNLHPLVFSWCLSFFTFGFFTPYVFSKKPKSLIRTEWNKNKVPILVNAVIGKGGYLLILVAFTFEKVSYVAGFRQLSIVFAVLMGNQILGEESKFIRLSAAIIIFVGAYLIASSS